MSVIVAQYLFPEFPWVSDSQVNFVAGFCVVWVFAASQKLGLKLQIVISPGYNQIIFNALGIVEFQKYKAF